MIEGRFTPADQQLCEQLARQRSGRNRALGSIPQAGQTVEQTGEDDRTGTYGECAIARTFGIPWPIEEDWQDANGDVGHIEVRATQLPYGRLTIYLKDKRDKADRPFALVRLRIPNSFTIVGFYRPRWGLKREWWLERRGPGSGAYWLPAEVLADPARLDPAWRSFERRFCAEADARAVDAGFVCSECGHAADLRVRGELRCVGHRA